MKISKEMILKILKAENLTDDQKSELMILLRDQSSLLVSLIADQMPTNETKKDAKKGQGKELENLLETMAKESKKETTAPKEKKKSTKKGKTSKNGKVRDFVNSLRKGEKFRIDDVAKGTGLDRTSARNSLYTLYRNEEVQSDEVGIYFR